MSMHFYIRGNTPDGRFHTLALLAQGGETRRFLNVDTGRALFALAGEDGMPVLYEGRLPLPAGQAHKEPPREYFTPLAGELARIGMPVGTQPKRGPYFVACDLRTFKLAQPREIAIAQARLRGHCEGCGIAFVSIDATVWLPSGRILRKEAGTEQFGITDAPPAL